ncbi:hypothetical protein FGIG_03293 [Fasciola gigantica]|uniref:Serpin domain-containing protein n=1 Tax=Fasciola gigantica TaxID=46835 RepID=A0A504YDE8_FASGI|nr:hypothetical protein FGIG_03293 [Fasciola gigantica]
MTNPTTTELSDAIERSLLEFTEDFYGQVVRFQREEPTNVCVAPVCLYEMLAMLLSGSGGATRIELQQVLHWPDRFSDSMIHHAIRALTVSFLLPFARTGLARRMFLLKHGQLKPQFLNALHYYYKCTVEKIDTLNGAENKRRYINLWTTESTQHQIINLVPVKLITEASWSCILSALYCRTSNIKGATHEALFHLLNGARCYVHMMHKVDRIPFIELPELEASAIKLELRLPNYQLLLVLPYAIDGLVNLIQRLQHPEKLSTILAQDFTYEVLSVYVPQFTLGHGTHPDLNPILFGMGLISLFDRNKADLSGMMEEMNLSISHVFHKTILEITDLGITNQAVIASRRMQAIREFRADHPFFICLLYDHRTPIAIGHVVKPRRSHLPVYVNLK